MSTPSTSRAHAATWIRLATLALLWGSGFLFIKLALRGFTPYQIVLVRLALGGLVLVAFIYATKRTLPRGRGVWLNLTVAALFANVLPYLLFALAERQIDSAVAGLINATTPLLTVLTALAVRHEARPSGVQLVGLVVGITGTAVLLAPWSLGTQFTSWGALAALTASLCYAISYVYMDRYLVRRDTSPLGLSAAQLLAATTLTAIGAPIAGGSALALTWRTDAVISLAVLGIAGTGIAYVLNYRIISDDGASVASLVTYLLPITAVLLGLVVLGEKPTVHALVGMLIVLAGVALARRPSASVAHPPATRAGQSDT